jgi:predicted O-linked N-acetylglucosamine transferase (SPINDLY family)
MTDRDAAKLIHDLRVDILVDLTGYTAGCRPEILAWRPAPIAVNYLGYPGTMGAAFVDYVIADPIVLPFDQQPFYAEKIVHLPGSFQPNDRQRLIAETPTREAAGLPEKGFVFCCFGRSYKITEPIFEVWMRLLKAVESSLLWLSDTNDAAKEKLRAAARSGEVDEARLVFAPKLEAPDEHLARHRLADLFLDTWPYNAHATASDALFAGLPIVTTPGNSFAGKVGASLLSAVGLSDLDAPDLAAYEALALQLAKEPEKLADCKARLERQRLTAPLFAADAYVRHLEAAYADMHGRWRTGTPPQSFAVPKE